jgi:hypothetical protein
MPKTITGAATQIDIADHCTLRFIREATGIRSKIFCFEEFAPEARSFEKNSMYNIKSAKIVPTSNGPAFWNIKLATATTKPMATSETSTNSSRLAEFYSKVGSDLVCRLK